MLDFTNSGMSHWSSFSKTDDETLFAGGCSGGLCFLNLYLNSEKSPVKFEIVEDMKFFVGESINSI